MGKTRGNSETSSLRHGQFDEMEPFPRYSTSRSSVHTGRVVGRLVVLMLSLATVGFVAASFGATLLHVTLLTPRYDGVHFGVRMWSLGAGPEENAYDKMFFDADRHAWLNGGGRVCGVLGLVFAVAAAALAASSLACLCVSERARQADDLERERAVHADRREQELRHADPCGASEEGVKAVGGVDLRTIDSHMKPACYYIQRENARRLTEFNVGVSLVVFSVLAIVATLIATIYSGVYLKGDGFANDVADIFAGLGIKATARDIKDSSRRDLQAGFWLLMVSILTTFCSLMLTVLPCVSGLDLTGADLVPAPLTEYHQNNAASDRSPFGEDDLVQSNDGASCKRVSPHHDDDDDEVESMAVEPDGKA